MRAIVKLLFENLRYRWIEWRADELHGEAIVARAKEVLEA